MMGRSLLAERLHRFHLGSCKILEGRYSLSVLSVDSKFNGLPE